jgi:hypothetical protein
MEITHETEFTFSFEEGLLYLDRINGLRGIGDVIFHEEFIWGIPHLDSSMPLVTSEEFGIKYYALSLLDVPEDIIHLIGNYLDFSGLYD